MIFDARACHARSNQIEIQREFFLLSPLFYSSFLFLFFFYSSRFGPPTRRRVRVILFFQRARRNRRGVTRGDRDLTFPAKKIVSIRRTLLIEVVAREIVGEIIGSRLVFVS